MKRCLSGLVFLSVLVLGGCSADKKADAAQPEARKEGSVAPRPSVVETPGEPYREVAVAGGSRITGTLDFLGEVPADSVVQIPADVQGCGGTAVARSIERTGSRIGGAVVWISDIRAGKALPMERRFELLNSECLLHPRVQAVLSPATLNVGSGDAALHQNHIINVATGELEAIAPFSDNGVVIPFDRLLTKPAQLEITCELHPWSKAWIIVLDHPYFSVTARSGSFSIDNVPPGTYRVKAWHPHLGVTEQSVTVSGSDTNLELKLGSPPEANTAPATE
ncbi:MAG: hypothetical protein ACR2GK_08810 [Gemmatimonadaceae bacterium]